MSMLDRYRKPGGFYQLLALLETCGAQKQEKFLEIIRAEDSRWSDAIRTKMLDMKRIYSWTDETLAEIIGTLQDLTLAVAVHAAPTNVKDRILKLLSHGRKRKIDDLCSSKPSPGEIATTHVKIIETVRKMAHDGFLRFDKIDPALHIEDEIEEMLKHPPDAQHQAPPVNAPASPSMFQIEYDDQSSPPADEHPHDAHAEPSTMELATLKKKLADLSKENAVLRHDLSIVRGKLDQIKKIA